MIMIFTHKVKNKYWDYSFGRIKNHCPIVETQIAKSVGYAKPSINMFHSHGSLSC